MNLPTYPTYPKYRITNFIRNWGNYYLNRLCETGNGELLRAWRTIEWMTKIIRNSRELTKKMNNSSDENN